MAGKIESEQGEGEQTRVFSISLADSMRVQEEQYRKRLKVQAYIDRMQELMPGMPIHVTDEMVESIING